MSIVTFTLETDNLEDIENIEVNFRNKKDYDYKTSTIYDEEGRPEKIVTTYTYAEED